MPAMIPLSSSVSPMRSTSRMRIMPMVLPSTMVRQ